MKGGKYTDNGIFTTNYRNLDQLVQSPLSHSTLNKISFELNKQPLSRHPSHKVMEEGEVCPGSPGFQSKYPVAHLSPNKIFQNFSI